MEENEKTPEQLKSENSLNFANKMSSEIAKIEKIRERESRRRIDTDTLKSALQDAYKSSKILQQQSENMRIINGTLKEIQFYKANILTYDHYLVPIDASKYIGKKDKYYKDLRKACIELEKYHIKTLCPWLIEQELRFGEIYIYKQHGENNITFFKVPNSMCKMTHSREFITGYSIKLSDINDNTLDYYPADIQKLYKKYKNGQLKNDKNLVDNYYKLDINKAVAFSPEILESKGIPYYAGLLLSLSRIEDMEDANIENANAENFKLIHQLIPNEKGVITVDYNEAYQYHQALKNVCPDGVEPVSTPYEIDSVTLTNTSAKNYNYLNDLKTNLFDSSGVDSSLFNSANRSTAQAVIYSACIDSLLSKNLLDRIIIWLNYDFKSNSVLKNFRICFTDTDIYNKEQKISAANGRLTTWGSRLEYFAICGYKPLDALNLLITEDLMDIDDYLSPLMNSHTMSSKNTSNAGGRPKVEENGDPNITSTSGEN